MYKKLFLFLFVVLCKTIHAQVVTKTYAANGTGADAKPNVILKLKNDNTYDLQVFNDNYFTWQFYNGGYKSKADTMFLEYKQIYQAPVCQLIDTFHRERIVNFLYVDANDKIVDTFPVAFSGDTINMDHFPLEYRAMENDNNAKSNIKYTWYVPDFKGKEMSVKFYKPGRNTKDILLISLIKKDDYLLIDEQTKYFFAPFDKLKEQ